ncbi:MAG: DUF11 domain-containing protein [Methanobacterium sp.]
MTITGDKNSLNVGDTVKLTITSLNNGPKSADIKVDYKISFGLKLLSSQGTGTYDSETGVWNVGILPAGGNATMELTLQTNNAGHFINLVSVYGDLALFSTKSLSGVVRAFSVKAASVGDPNPGNNQASYDITSIDPVQTADTNTFTYDFPPVTPPTQPQPPNNPPTPPGPTPPEPQPPGPTPPNNSSQPTGQLGRDILTVRDVVSTGTQLDAGKLVCEQNDQNSWKTVGDILNEVFGSPDFDILALIALLAYMTSFLLSAGYGLLLGWTIAGIMAASFLVYAAILFIITMLILIWVLYKFYSRPKS